MNMTSNSAVNIAILGPALLTDGKLFGELHSWTSHNNTALMA